MNLQEAVHHYYGKKNSKSISDRMSKDEIRSELKEQHSFTDEETKRILREISDLELANLHPSMNNPTGLKYTLFFSYFSFLVALTALGYSIYTLQKTQTEPLLQMLPYVILVGSLFLLAKHGNRIINHLKNKR